MSSRAENLDMRHFGPSIETEFTQVIGEVPLVHRSINCRVYTTRTLQNSTIAKDPMLHSSYHVSTTAARNLEGSALACPTPRKAQPHWTARFEQCVVRAACREVLVDGEPRALQPRAFELLTYLIENRERVVSADELLETSGAP